VVQIHAIAAVAALAIGCGVLLLRKGTPRHKAPGATWVAVMMVVALTSFGS
jgi:uncharacterized membrane protein